MEVFTAFYSGIPEHAAHYSPWTWLSGGFAAMALGRSRYAPAAVFASLVIDKGVVHIPAGFIHLVGGPIAGDGAVPHRHRRAGSGGRRKRREDGIDISAADYYG